MDNFQSRFKDFLNLQWIINVYNNPLTCSLENLPKVVEEELALMRQDVSIPIEMGINFWKNICPQKYPSVSDFFLCLALRIFASHHFLQCLKLKTNLETN